MTQDEVIRRAKLYHGEKYDYSSIVYINQQHKIDVVCPTHGIFHKWPKDFINGSGCPKCGAEAAGKKLADTTETFIEKAIKTHGTTYDYSKVRYTNNSTKVEITCREHGSFWQEPWVHIAGHKCPYCSGNKIKPIVQLIPKMLDVHKNKYDYSNSKITDRYPYIVITCPEHGDFEQRVHDHIAGHGCPKCFSPGFNKDKPGILYYLSINNGEAYKIGITNRTVETRFSPAELQSIKVLFAIEDNGAHVYNTEQLLLEKYKSNKYAGPKLLLSGNTELFSTDIFNTKYPTTLKEINDIT